MDYMKRIADRLLALKLEAFGATLITGPKGCGKTTTAKQKAKSYIEFQDEDRRKNYLLIANTQPSDLLKGEKPRLFDEWQDAPKIWGAIRKYIDDSGECGQFILTGSSSKNVNVPHTGTMRISRLQMYPMSLYESGESNGEISLSELFESPQNFTGCNSPLSIDQIKFAICRGGWPRSLNVKTDRSKLAIAQDLLFQTCDADISSIGSGEKSSRTAHTILQSYARNICTLADTKTLYQDVTANNDISKATYYSYIDALQKLCIIEDVEAWCPAIRSKTTIRATAKRNLIDPSVACAALGISPRYFDSDYNTLGFMFESLCLRDLKIYSCALGGTLSYYRDRYGLEADAVLHLGNGDYALIEIKLGEYGVEEGANHLCEIEKLITAHNSDKTKATLRLPKLKIIITASGYGYKRDDGVFVIPVGCLRD